MTRHAAASIAEAATAITGTMRSSTFCIGHVGECGHAGVGVHQRPLVRRQPVLYQERPVGDLPQPHPALKMGNELGFGIGQAEEFGRTGDLARRLGVDDARLGVRQQPLRQADLLGISRAHRGEVRKAMEHRHV